MDVEDVLIGGCLSLSRKPAESRPGCENPLQPGATLFFRNRAVFKCNVDGLPNRFAGKQRLQKPIVFAFKAFVIDGILMPVNGEEDLLWRQHGDTANMP